MSSVCLFISFLEMFPCRIVLASPDDCVTCPYHFSTTSADDNQVKEFNSKLSRGGQERHSHRKWDWNAKVAQTPLKTGRTTATPPEAQHPISEDNACWSSPATTTWCWQTPLISTRHLGAGLGMCPTEHITRLITS